MLPGAAIGAILAPISGRLLDKVGPKTDPVWFDVDCHWLACLSPRFAFAFHLEPSCWTCLLHDRDRLSLQQYDDHRLKQADSCVVRGR